MPKPPLDKKHSVIEYELMDAMIKGLQDFRPDLSYPESHSDLEACARGIMERFHIKRRKKNVSFWTGKLERTGKNIPKD